MKKLNLTLAALLLCANAAAIADATAPTQITIRGSEVDVSDIQQKIRNAPGDINVVIGATNLNASQAAIIYSELKTSRNQVTTAAYGGMMAPEVIILLAGKKRFVHTSARLFLPVRNADLRVQDGESDELLIAIQQKLLGDLPDVDSYIVKLTIGTYQGNLSSKTPTKGIAPNKSWIEGGLVTKIMAGTPPVLI